MYGGGFLAQLLANYKAWTQSGGGVGAQTAPSLPSANPAACFSAAFQMPYGMVGTAAFFSLLALLIFMGLRMGLGGGGIRDKMRNLTYSDKGTYGTAGFMTAEEMHSVLDVTARIRQTDGIILGKKDGKIISLPADTKLNRHIAVYGSSGSMKSRAFCRNAIFQAVRRGESILATDPKSELYNDMAAYLAEEGYTVKIFNLVDLEHSDSWNLLREIGGQEIMAQILADTVIKNTGAGKVDHFWDNAELNLLKALILYVDQGYPPQHANMGEVYNLLTQKSEQELQALFDILPVIHPAKAPFQLFKQSSESVRSGVVIGLGSRMQIFQNQLIRDITSYDDIDLVLPGKEKCAYFCVLNDQSSAFEFLSSLFFSFLFIRLVSYADRCPGGKLPVAVNVIGDEWPNIGTVLDFQKKISTIRGRNIHMTGLVFQGLSQLQNRYPDGQWQEILGNCDTQLFLGTTDPFTAKMVSERTGIASVQVSSQSRRLGTYRISNYVPEYRETESVGKRPIYTTDEIMRLPIQKALVILRGQKVLEVDKLDYTLHPDYPRLKPVRSSDHIPAWHTRKVVPPDPPVPIRRREARKEPSRPSYTPADKESILK